MTDDKGPMKSEPHSPPFLSIVIPVLDEAPNLPELLSRIQDVVKTLTDHYEIIVVDDGSTDGSFEVLTKLREDDRSIKAIQLRCPHGKAAALATGLKEAMGDRIIMMDGDLQDQPEEIPKLLAKLDEGYDLICGWRVTRHDPWLKVVASKIFNLVTRYLTGVKIHDANCGLKACRGEVIEGLGLHGELHRYIPVLAQWKGFKVAELAVDHQPRRHGMSKYGSERFLRGFLDLLTVMMVTRYLRRPLHLFGFWGLVLIVVGLMINLYLVVGWLLGQWWLGDRPMLLFGVLLMIIGIQVALFGLLAEIVTYRNRHDHEISIRHTLR